MKQKNDETNNGGGTRDQRRLRPGCATSAVFAIRCPTRILGQALPDEPKRLAASRPPQRRRSDRRILLRDALHGAPLAQGQRVRAALLPFDLQNRRATCRPEEWKRIHPGTAAVRRGSCRSLELAGTSQGGLNTSGCGPAIDSMIDRLFRHTDVHTSCALHLLIV